MPSLKTRRSTREETRLAIMTKADELFRQYGFEKATVADIARELGMSAANIYKFFPSKRAIVESSAERNLAVLAEAVSKVTRRPRGAMERMEEALLVIHHFHQQRLVRDRPRMVKLLMTAIDENWACIRRYDEFLLDTFSGLIGEGIESGEFRATPVRAAAQNVIQCLSLVIKPNLHSLHIPIEGEAWIREQVRFVAGALR